MNIYVAASWRTPSQPHVVDVLRRDGHTVYDFRDHGFGWSQVSEKPTEEWSLTHYLDALASDRAIEGFQRDWINLIEADACLLLTPSGRSAHLELGVAIGLGKLTVVLLDGWDGEPDLMYKAANCLARTLGDARNFLNAWQFVKDHPSPLGGA